MKFYNPFKPHIIQSCSGFYFIRVFKIPDGWSYLGYNNDEWFLTKSLAFKAVFLDTAKSKLSEMYVQGKKDRVIHWRPNKN